MAVTVATRPAQAQCPDEAAMRAALAQVDPARAARTARYAQVVPRELYGKAFSAVGRPFSAREKDRVTGVIVAPLPAADIWRAINDEEHHAAGYLPVDFSTVVEGRARGADRVLFQYISKAGIGRWWASRVRINGKLHAATEGRIWELYWQDWMAEVDRTQPPVRDIARKIHPITRSEGAWLLIPLSESCTLVEEYSSSDPGGALGVIQALVAAGAVRDTLTGLLRMAREHHCEPEPGFFGPNAKLLKQAAPD